MNRIQRLLREVRDVMKRDYDFEAVSVVVKGPKGETVKMPIVGINAAVSEEADKTTGADRWVFEHVPTSDQAGITIEAIKNACGYESYDHTRKALRRLLDDGKIVKDGKGYKRKKLSA